MPATLKSRLPEIAASLRPLVDAALKASAEEIAESARQKVPVRSGELQNAIHVEGGGGAYAVVAGGHDAFYGHLVEFGHEPGGVLPGAPPYPFLVPAFDENRDDVVDRVSNALKAL